jgi:hypothetical protein
LACNAIDRFNSSADSSPRRRSRVCLSDCACSSARAWAARAQFVEVDEKIREERGKIGRSAIAGDLVVLVDGNFKLFNQMADATFDPD